MMTPVLWLLIFFKLCVCTVNLKMVKQLPQRFHYEKIEIYPYEQRVKFFGVCRCCKKYARIVQDGVCSVCLDDLTYR